MFFDEGFTDGDPSSPHATHQNQVHHNQPAICNHQRVDSGMLPNAQSVQACEELAYKLLVSLPRSRLATIQRRIAPLLQFDVVGSLPTEVSLQIFSHLSSQTLLQCALVSRRWRALADDQFLWKNLCLVRGWAWKQPSRIPGFHAMLAHSRDDSDDEGMGDSDEDGEDDAQMMVQPQVPDPPASHHHHHYHVDHPFRSSKVRVRHSAPSILPSAVVGTVPAVAVPKPNYKLLFQTHVRLHNRFLSASYRLSSLQMRGAPANAHTNTIYCLQLYTYPSTGVQVLFTGSRDKSIREWNLGTGMVERVVRGVHESSVLSLCVANGLLASAGSDRRVVVWDLEENALVKVICDHEDSVLCVRFDERQLVSCSKDRTVRTYLFPDLTPHFVLGAHRAAVNAVSISQSLIVSGSGDRSIRLWDAQTGQLLRTFENHHTRGIASIDFKPPYVLSGSSDKHLRLFDITSLQGWSTSPEYEHSQQPAAAPFSFPFTFQFPYGSGVMPCTVCQACGSPNEGGSGGSGDSTSSGGGGGGGTGGGGGVEVSGQGGRRRRRHEGCTHGDLVRSVVLGEDFVLSGSYDMSIKVWDRKSGALVADLTGGHTGRIFCIGFDCTKIVSCGEDQRICIWDFSHGIDTSFVNL